MNHHLTLLTSGLFACFTMMASATEQTIELSPSIHLFDMGAGFVAGMSHNGLWGVYRMADFDEEDAVARRMNLVTGEIEVLPLIAEQGAPHICAPHDITDDGTRIYGAYDRLPAYYDLTDRQWHDLPLNFRYRGYTGYAGDVTPDGQWACGWLMGSMTSFRPALWHDNEAIELGDMPTYEEMYRRGIIDDEDFQHHTSRGDTPNIAFWKISNDGKYVLASTDHNYPGWGCAWFVYNTETSTYTWIEDPQMPAHCFTSGASMSDNGEWISARWTGTKLMPDGTWEDVHTGFRYHIPDGKIDYQAGGGKIGDDGFSCGLSVNVDGVRVSFESILRQVYGLDVKAQTGYDSFGTLFEMSSDRRTVLCQPGYRQIAISATCPIPFPEAAKKVNLLGESRVAPAPGAVLSRLEDFTIEFNARAEWDGVTFPEIWKGNEFVTMASMVSDSGNNRKFSVSFPGLRLEEGVTYELRLPQGMFHTVSGSHSMPEGRIEYTGRADSPLRPLAVSPEEGTSLRELSLYSLIQLTFDSDPVLTDSAEAFLYQDDEKSPLCGLNIAVSGRNMALYPSAARLLPKDRNFRVVIKENSFTDVAGNCPNDEITLDYVGGYVVVHGDGRILFSDRFDNPNESLYKFMLYEGDHLEPSDNMQAIGFETDNTPWNFSVRDDDAYDYCAAATSDYRAGGQADDWMVLPALNITDGSEILRFKAQSHLLGREDRLRVFVWPCDAMVINLDDDIMTRLREEADLVFDDLLAPGLFENILAGDWQEYSVDLSSYKGKQVYIAFANLNEGGSTLFVDDIVVERAGEISVTLNLPESVVGADPVEVSCSLSGESREIGLLKAEYSLDGSGSTVSYEAENITISDEEPFTFTFPGKCSLNEGELNHITIVIDADGKKQTHSFSIANPLFEAQRGVLIEEGTGEWCGFCPSGFAALEYLNDSYPGRINEVSIHNNDSYAFEHYVSFMGFSAFPTGRVDRLPFMLSPISTDMATGMLSFTSRDGDSTFADIVSRRLELPALAELSLEDCVIDGQEGKISARLSVTPALNLHDIDWNVFTVVTEYGLIGLQQNNYSGYTDPLMAEWGERDTKTIYRLPAVARAIGSSSFYGDAGRLPSELEAGRSYEVSLNLLLPDGIQEASKCRLVVALLSAADGIAVNSVSAGYGLTDSGIKIRENYQQSFSAADGSVLYDGTSEGVTVFNLTGLEIPNRNLTGPVIARHRNGASIKIIL